MEIKMKVFNRMISYIALFVVFVFGPLLYVQTSRGSSVNYYFLMNQWEADLLKPYLSNSELQTVFNNATDYIVKSDGEFPNAQSVMTFTDYNVLVDAINAGTIHAGTTYLMYDNEHWSFTPLQQQENPPLYEQQFCDMAHSAGFKCILTPAVNLTVVTNPGTTDKYNSYLNDSYPVEAKYAEVFNIQAQQIETNLRKFTNFVTTAVQQAKAANPSIIITVGISTGPAGQTVTASQILAAINASPIKGFWFNIPQQSAYCPSCTEARPDIAASVLKTLYGF